MITKTIIIRYKFFWFLWSMKTRNWWQNCFDTEVNPRKKIQYINSDKIIKLSGESKLFRTVFYCLKYLNIGFHLSLSKEIYFLPSMHYHARATGYFRFIISAICSNLYRLTWCYYIGNFKTWNLYSYKIFTLQKTVIS